jgi:sugar phosphate isomerase/epimerase
MDVGHISVYKGKVKEAEENFFRAHARHIRSAHIHDNNGEWDMHDVIGNGKIDFLPYFRLLASQNAYCIFEVRPKESAVECLRRFREQLAPKL